MFFQHHPCNLVLYPSVYPLHARFTLADNVTAFACFISGTRRGHHFNRYLQSFDDSGLSQGLSIKRNRITQFITLIMLCWPLKHIYHSKPRPEAWSKVTVKQKKPPLPQSFNPGVNGDSNISCNQYWLMLFIYSFLAISGHHQTEKRITLSGPWTHLWCGHRQPGVSCPNNIPIFRILNSASRWASCGSKYNNHHHYETHGMSIFIMFFVMHTHLYIFCLLLLLLLLLLDVCQTKTLSFIVNGQRIDSIGHLMLGWAH